MKTNLPVILLRGLVLLPNNEIRLEFDNDDSKNIIDVAELFHDKHILVTSHKNYLEEVTNKNDLPEIGVISKITHRIELPNGKTRVVIKGESRAHVFEYLNVNNNDILESIITEIDDVNVDEQDEKMLVRKLYHELENYINIVPYMSNSILNHIKNIKNLDTLSDTIVPELPVSVDRLLEYLVEVDPKERALMILNDIYQELESYKVEEEIDRKVKENIDKSQKEFILREKLQLIKEELGENYSREDELDELSLKISELDAPIYIKRRLEKEKKRYESLPPMSQEVNVIKNYIDNLLSLPWNKYSSEIHDLKLVKEKLDVTHYGLEEIKNRIIEYLAVKEKTNTIKGPILCLVGPPGVGKTSLAKSIATSMRRKFVKFSVGGMDDEAEIMGHRKTYVGASPGRVITSLIKAKVANPVLLIDEIDKMTKSYNGDPASALLEVLDPEQNAYFSDHYIEEEFDLSNVLFILTANYIEDIPEALRDRLEVIELSGYTEYEKVDLTENYLIPRELENHGLKENIRFTKEAILEIVNYYTKEAGVRELERMIAKILRKLVTEELVEHKDINNLVIRKNDVVKYLGKRKFEFITQGIRESGVINGLAYTRYGGDTLPIEVTHYPGTGNLVLTGSLGDVMKESCRIAYSYVKANYEKFGINFKVFKTNDIHIHVPEGAVPKDGPSAGIAIVTALISSLLNIRISSKIALTGEITLRGKVIAIGGLKEKSIGAGRNHIKTIFIPKDNLKDIEDIPKEVTSKIKYIPVTNYGDVFNILFGGSEVNEKRNFKTAHGNVRSYELNKS